MSTYPYKLVIFDFDGTLADSFAWFLDVFDGAALKFGFKPFDRSDLATLRRMSSRDLMRRQNVPVWKLAALAIHARKHQSENLDAITLFDGVSEMIEALSARGVTLALITSNAEDNVRAVLEPALSAKFTYFACGSSIFGKAAKFRKVIKAAKLHARDILSVGDELRDIDAARATGVWAGAVSWGYADAQALSEAGPDHLFATPADIAALTHLGGQ